MDEEAFRALLRSEFGISSRKDMNIHQLSRLAQLFAEQYGVTYTAPAKGRNRRVTPLSRPDWIEITDSMPYAAEKRQILVIWRKLGYSHDPAWIRGSNGRSGATVLSGSRTGNRFPYCCPTCSGVKRRSRRSMTASELKEAVLARYRSVYAFCRAHPETKACNGVSGAFRAISGKMARAGGKDSGGAFRGRRKPTGQRRDAGSCGKGRCRKSAVPIVAVLTAGSAFPAGNRRNEKARSCFSGCFKGDKMSKARIREIVTLTREGWRPYDAEPDHSVYERLGCTHVLRGNRRKPFWFVRGDVFCCIAAARITAR